MSSILQADWSETYQGSATVKEEFSNISFPSYKITGWYSTKTDTILVTGDEMKGFYTVYVWNTPCGPLEIMKRVLNQFYDVLGLFNLPIH